MNSALVLAVVVGLGVVGFSAGSTVLAKNRTEKVRVKLLEFKIKRKPKSVKADGTVKFKVKNIGGEEHEMVVVRTDGTPLPTKADGSVDESTLEESDEFGEVEDLGPKKRKTLKVKGLRPGTYVLFCNLVDTERDGSTVSHYAQGMSTTFTVK